MAEHVFKKLLWLQGKYWSREDIFISLEIREAFLAGRKCSLLVAPAYTCMSMIFQFLQPVVPIISLIYLQNSYYVLLEVLLGGEEIQCLVQTVP